jgi:hypothetical protein
LGNPFKAAAFNRRQMLASSLEQPYLHGVLRHRPETFVSGHKYKIGQLVYYLGRDRAPGVYQVTQLLPPEGEVFQYRIRNVNEPHERVAKENELRRA